MQYDLPHELSFTDRASYITWRATWRQQYRELTAQIRANKHALKQDQRLHCGMYQARYQNHREILRSEANGMLDTRAHAKRRAGQLQAANRKQAA
jgi:hypothetical protein